MALCAIVEAPWPRYIGFHEASPFHIHGEHCRAAIDPTAVLAGADGAAVAILSGDEPIACLVPAETYERLVGKIEDAERAEMCGSGSRSSARRWM